MIASITHRDSDRSRLVTSKVFFCTDWALVTMEEDESASKRSKLVAESKAECEKPAKGLFKQPLPILPTRSGKLTRSVPLSESKESTVVAGRLTWSDESPTPSQRLLG